MAVEMMSNASHLGPRPSEPHGGAELASLSRAALAVLRTVEATGPVSLTDLAAASGSHENTLRDHLRVLGEAGLVRRATAPRRGPGRPAWLYSAIPGRAGRVAEYAGLARTLAGVLHRTSEQPFDDAVAAGTEWGHELAREVEPAPETDRNAEDRVARGQVVTLLAQMGFSPETDPEARSVRLPRCPLLDAAREYPDVVCGVHLGIAKGALREYGADDAHAALLPFSEPGACRLHLAAR
jgi:predicted ArsR family transcriptional regulator